MSAFWQVTKIITVPASGTADFTLPNEVGLERLTVWAISGSRALANMTFQPQINGTNYNSPVVITTAPAADVLYRSGGASTENDLFPQIKKPSPGDQSPDPFVFSIHMTNADTHPATITIYAIAIAHVGG